MKLRPIIARECVDGMRLLSQERNSASIEFGDGPRPELAEHEITGLALDETHDAVPIPFGADDGIGFPVADALAGFDDGGTRRDQTFPGESAATVVGAIPFAALFLPTAQIRVPGPAGALVGPDVPLDRLVTNPEAVFPAPATRDLFGAPVLVEPGMDLCPVGRREALSAPGAGAPAAGVPISELWAIAAIIPRRIATDLPTDRATVAAESSGNGRGGIAMLAEQAKGVSFGGGDLCIHGRLHSLGGELKSTGITGHRFCGRPCCT